MKILLVKPISNDSQKYSSTVRWLLKDYSGQILKTSQVMAEKSEVITLDAAPYDDERLRKMVQEKVGIVLHLLILLLK